MDFSLVTTEDLFQELTKRNDAVCFSYYKSLDKGRSVTDCCYSGPKVILYGMLVSAMVDLLNAEEDTVECD